MAGLKRGGRRGTALSTQKTSCAHHSVQFSTDFKIKILFGGDTIQLLGNEFCLFLYHPSGPHHSDGSAGQREGRHVHLDCCGG